MIDPTIILELLVKRARADGYASPKQRTGSGWGEISPTLADELKSGRGQREEALRIAERALASGDPANIITALSAAQSYERQGLTLERRQERMAKNEIQRAREDAEQARIVVEREARSAEQARRDIEEARRSAGGKKTAALQTADGNKRWEPYINEFNDLLDQNPEMTEAKARKKVYDQMARSGVFPTQAAPSDTTLRHWLKRKSTPR